MLLSLHLRLHCSLMLIEMDSIIAANLLCESAMQTLSEEEIRTYSVNKSLCFLFFIRFSFILSKRKPHTHSPGILYTFTPWAIYFSRYVWYASRNVSTRPITIHADMFAVYWNDALRTTRKRLPDSGDATAVAVAVAVAHTHIQYGFRVVCTLLMAFSQYLLYHVSINGCTFQY